MNKIRFGSVCSGLEAASVAWHPLGWSAAWLAEIEPFPSAVLAHHYPDVPNLGDMTALPGRIASGEVEAPDLFCGGTPCQAFSVAGLRKSLNDARGNLSLTFCEIANAIDTVRIGASQQPAIIFWENVPGVLSTKDNAFGCFLAGLAGEDDPIVPPGDKWTNAGCVYGPTRTVAWRVLDAQYFGVAQRRRRVFVVASARNDFDPAKVLFEFDGLRRDSAPRREAGKVAPTIPSRSTAGGGLGTDFDCDGGVIQQPFTLAIRGRGDTHNLEYRQDGTANALLTPNGGRAGIGVGAIAAPAYAIQAGALRTNTDSGPDGVGVQADHAYTLEARAEVQCVAAPVTQFGDMAGTLTARHDSSPCADRGMNVVAQPMPINTMVALRHEALGRGTGFGIGEAGDPAYTLTKGHSHAVAQPMTIRPDATPKWNNDLAFTLTQPSPTGGGQPQAVMQAMQVRRLTPVECERLQGFPDNYTAIPWRKKPASECPDGPRYKALGNSWAVPVVRWIGKRIQDQLL